MKTKILLSILTIGLMVSAFGQKPTMELTFTALNNEQYVPLDSIFIENLTQGGDITLIAPDTVLQLVYTNIGDNQAMSDNGFSVSQNYPNPFKQQTQVNLFLAEKENIKIIVRDVLGRELANYINTLNQGNHTFTFYPGNAKYYFLTVTGEKTSKTIKMVNASSNLTLTPQCKIAYTAYNETPESHKSQDAINDFVFSLGDELRFIAYSNTPELINGSDVLEDAPLNSQDYTFNILEGVPCPGTPSVTYEEQMYRTVQIGNQCWLKENMNVGSMIPGTQDMADNSIMEKYCYNNEPDSCTKYGGLYQWNEMMQYTTVQGTQGICPTGWHLPSDGEWCIATEFIDQTTDCITIGWNGTDVGTKMKSTTSWNPGINSTNSSGFTALSGGYRALYGNFTWQGSMAVFWTSSVSPPSYAWIRIYGGNYSQINRGYDDIDFGFSVRCLKND